MTREPKQRLGCDRCKRDAPTYCYDRITGTHSVWFCVECEKILFDWTEIKVHP